MKKAFVINHFDNHLIIEENGKKLLIDTGSPVSIVEDDVMLCGQHITSAFNLVSIDHLSELLGMHVDALVGNDILSRFLVMIDYCGHSITFSDEPLALDGAESIPLETFMGYLKINMSVLGEENAFFLDTGAKISYLDSGKTKGLSPECEGTDFYIGIGKFTTPIFNLDATIGAYTFNTQFGNLPELLNSTLIGVTGVSGIIGYDLFAQFKILLDYQNKKMYYLPFEG